MIPLPLSFYEGDDVVQIAKNLLGKLLITQFEGVITGGLITETEAYAGVTDRASHAYGGRRTKRTEVMYGAPGKAYVYLCMGIHSLLNVVTAKEGTPHAVLIRAIQPTHGCQVILQRRKKEKMAPSVCGGPGSLSVALGITRQHNGLPLNAPPLMICESDLKVEEAEITAGPRIGIHYAQEDALLPYRFLKKGFFQTRDC